MRNTTILLLILLTLSACSTDDVESLNNAIEDVNNGGTGDTSGDNSGNIDENQSTYILTSADVLKPILLAGGIWGQYQHYSSISDYIIPTDPDFRREYRFNSSAMTTYLGGHYNYGNSGSFLTKDIIVDGSNYMYLKDIEYSGLNTDDKAIYYNLSDNTFYIYYKIYDPVNGNTYQHIYFKVM